MEIITNIKWRSGYEMKIVMDNNIETSILAFNLSHSIDH